MTKNEALRMALEALQAIQPECDDFHHKKKEMHDWSETCRPLERYNQAINAIKEALAQPDQEPVAWMYPNALCDKACLYLCTKGFTQFPECADRLQPKEPEQEPDYKAIGQQAYESGYSTGYMDCAVKMKAQPEQEKERCVGCEACIDTACGRDECPKGWPKAAHPKQEPVAWMDIDEKGAASGLRYWHEPENRHEVPLYTTPPQRTWVGLTDEEVNELVEHTECEDYYGLVEATEAKLKEKNT